MRGFLKQAKMLNALRQIALLGFVCSVLYSCAGGIDGTAIVTDCEVGSDQGNTFRGRWTNFTVPVAFHQGDFTSTEMAQIMVAAQTWNAFFATSMGHSFIDFGPDPTNPRTATSGIPGACTQDTSIVSGSGYSAPIVIFKDHAWNASYPTAAIALTTSCTSPNPDGVADTWRAWIEVNYQYFFNAGQDQPDLQSVILHEFGHLGGLGHSCEYTGGTGIPSCSESGLNPDYVSAVMYPTFYFDPTTLLGQVKQTLQTNDEGRMNCLYKN